MEAVRLDPTYVAKVGANYREKFTRLVDGVEVMPLVVLDTKSAVLAVESENDNSQASEMMAVLKQGFDGLPVWLVGHVAKPNLNRSDAASLTTRGASAIDGDANQTIFLVLEKGQRFFLLGKVRFAPWWFELEIMSYTSQTFTKDEFGPSGLIAYFGVLFGLPGMRTDASTPFGPPHLLTQKSASNPKFDP